MTDHCYPEPDEDEGHLYVREMEDHELLEEFQHALGVLEAMTSEIDHRLGDDYSMIGQGMDSPLDNEQIPHLLGAIQHAQTDE